MGSEWTLVGLHYETFLMYVHTHEPTEKLLLGKPSVILFIQLRSFILCIKNHKTIQW